MQSNILYLDEQSIIRNVNLFDDYRWHHVSAVRLLQGPHREGVYSDVLQPQWTGLLMTSCSHSCFDKLVRHLVPHLTRRYSECGLGKSESKFDWNCAALSHLLGSD